MNSQQLNELNSRREKDGTFGSKLHPEAGFAVDAPAAAPDLHEMDAARSELLAQWSDMQEDPDRDPEAFEALDAALQKSSVECASAAVLAEYPDAATLVLKENEDGENQYEIEKILDEDGNSLADTEDPDFDIPYGDNGFARETVWMLDPTNDGWASDRAVITKKMGTKFAAVDLKAVLASL